MFYKLIEKKRNEWLSSPECKVRDLIHYIEHQGKMRDAQIEAIETFLFLKLACQNKPLWRLFCEGTFNSLNLDPLEISHIARQVLMKSPAAKALFEYSRMTDRNGRQLAPQMEQFIKNNPETIDYEQAFRDIFYGVSYPDYIFSLPMGAGKTFLMAAFIHLELYFSMLEPENPSFAHKAVQRSSARMVGMECMSCQQKRRTNASIRFRWILIFSNHMHCRLLNNGRNVASGLTASG